MKNNVWPSRLYALDVSRGFAALSVVLWHWQHFAYKGHSLAPDFVRNSQPFYNILRLFYEKGSVGVEYFFILSGFIFFWLYSDSIKNGITSFGEFFLQRFSRLYPLHLATLLAVAILQAIYISREGFSFIYRFNDVYHFFLNVAFISKWGFENGWSFNAPVWSVSIEVLLYGVFFAVCFFRQGGMLFCLCISLSSFVILRITHDEIFNGSAMFFLGGFVFQFTRHLSIQNRLFQAFVFTISISAWLCVLTNHYVFEFSSMFADVGKIGKYVLLMFPGYILFPFTICSLVLFEINKGPILKPFSWIGNITYSSYLLHFPLQLLCGIAVSTGILKSGFYLHPFSLAIYFTTLIPLSYFVYIRFELPMQKMIRNKILRQKHS